MTSPFLAPGRDPSAHQGRPKDASFTYYTVPGMQGVSAGVQGLVANRDYYAPWHTPVPIVIDRMAAEVETASGTNFRIGLYAANVNWQPIGAPLADSGDLSCASTGVKTYTPATKLFLPPGLYLSILNSDSGPAMRKITGGLTGLYDGFSSSPFFRLYYVSRTYAAFPAPGTNWDNSLNAATTTDHLVFYRLTAP